MPVEVILPKVDMDMATGKISAWHVAPGDRVEKGAPLFDIETDKAAMEVESPETGILHHITDPGTEVPIGDVVGWLYADDETVGDPPTANAGSAQWELGKDNQSEHSNILVEENKQSESTESGSSPSQVRATPLARRLARETGVAISSLAGSGPRGRIQKRDVEAAINSIAKNTSSVTKSETTVVPKPTDDGILKNFIEGSYELVPHDGMRKTIAKRLTESKQTIPHFYVSVDVELDALLALRAQLNGAAATDKDGKPAYKLSVNDMTIKALALALRDVPDANVSWTDENMVMHKHADVGVAVAIPGGLITPIIRRAEEKPLSVISNEMKDLGTRAKERKLKPEEYQGGSTAVSNMGMMGVKDFSAVVNPPHATILAVGAGEKRPVVKDSEIAVATVMTVTLSTDHRCVDGALGAKLLAEFKGYIENPMSMLV
ncbi:MAG: pyruvate dehydrogenase complex dihydrolipoamide acetyltransferase [Pseudomonadota bacterium]